MLHGGTRDLLYAIIAAVLLAAVAWLWKRAQLGTFSRDHGRLVSCLGMWPRSLRA
jgi:hypothetical protein